MTIAEKDALAASPRLFESDILDKLSRIHHLTPPLVYGPIVLWLLAYASGYAGAGEILFAFLAGYVAWTLTEYFGHRFLFHTILPLPFGLGERLQFLIHGVHHIYPSDPLRLVMPPLLSAPIMLIALTLIRLIFGGAFAWPMLAGFIAGYILYDWTHYWTHHGQPKSKLGHLVRRLHMLHHFRDPERGFGVHAIWWDYIFGTNDERGQTPGTRAV